MTKRQIRKELADGGRYAPEVIESGLRKAERWMRAAYGAVDWTELQNETGDAVGQVAGYCEESLQKPDGLGTFNRELRK